tara:strand:+ start:2851 stop:3006 length:156 start_codon:yes stop_codon:yes gene_type:complete
MEVILVGMRKGRFADIMFKDGKIKTIIRMDPATYSRVYNLLLIAGMKELKV